MSQAAESATANGMRDVIAETKAKFEAASKHRLTITVVETGEIRRRVLGWRDVRRHHGAEQHLRRV